MRSSMKNSIWIIAQKFNKRLKSSAKKRHKTNFVKFQIKYLYLNTLFRRFMFIGHYGLGLAAKGVDKRPSLGTMFLAVQWPDLVWPVLLLIRVERFTIVPGNTVLTPLRF